MWKRDQAPKPTPSQPSASAPATVPQVPAAPASQTAAPVPAVEPAHHSGRIETHMVHIGKSVMIKGDLQGSEDLTVEGQVEGKIELNQHVLTIGAHARIKGQVFAKTVIILGTLNGNLTAAEKVEIRDGATVDGDVVSPKVAIAEGAQFHGSVDMSRGGKRSQPSPPSHAAPAMATQQAAATSSAPGTTH